MCASLSMAEDCHREKESVESSQFMDQVELLITIKITIESFE